MLRFLGTISFVAFWALILTLGRFELVWAPVSQGGSLSAVHYELDQKATDAFLAAATDIGQQATNAAITAVVDSGAVDALGQWAQNSVQQCMQQGFAALNQQANVISSAKVPVPEAHHNDVFSPPLPEESLAS